MPDNSSYQAFIDVETKKLSVVYPFLQSEQIKARAKIAWTKLQQKNNASNKRKTDVRVTRYQVVNQKKPALPSVDTKCSTNLSGPKSYLREQNVAERPKVSLLRQQLNNLSEDFFEVNDSPETTNSNYPRATLHSIDNTKLIQPKTQDVYDFQSSDDDVVITSTVPPKTEGRLRIKPYLRQHNNENKIPKFASQKKTKGYTNYTSQRQGNARVTATNGVKSPKKYSNKRLSETTMKLPLKEAAVVLDRNLESVSSLRPTNAVGDFSANQRSHRKQKEKLAGLDAFDQLISCDTIFETQPNHYSPDDSDSNSNCGLMTRISVKTPPQKPSYKAQATSFDTENSKQQFNEATTKRNDNHPTDIAFDVCTKNYERTNKPICKEQNGGSETIKKPFIQNKSTIKKSVSFAETARNSFPVEQNQIKNNEQFQRTTEKPMVECKCPEKHSSSSSLSKNRNAERNISPIVHTKNPYVNLRDLTVAPISNKNVKMLELKKVNTRPAVLAAPETSSSPERNEVETLKIIADTQSNLLNSQCAEIQIFQKVSDTVFDPKQPFKLIGTRINLLSKMSENVYKRIDRWVLQAEIITMTYKNEVEEDEDIKIDTSDFYPNVRMTNLNLGIKASAKYERQNETETAEKKKSMKSESELLPTVDELLAINGDYQFDEMFQFKDPNESSSSEDKLSSNAEENGFSKDLSQLSPTSSGNLQTPSTFVFPNYLLHNEESLESFSPLNESNLHLNYDEALPDMNSDTLIYDELKRKRKQTGKQLEHLLSRSQKDLNKNSRAKQEQKNNLKASPKKKTGRDRPLIDMLIDEIRAIPVPAATDLENIEIDEDSNVSIEDYLDCDCSLEKTHSPTLCDMFDDPELATESPYEIRSLRRNALFSKNLSLLTEDDFFD